MKVKFPTGVSEQCIEWLLENVGSGNLYRSTVTGEFYVNPISESNAWFFESECSPSRGFIRDTPCITVKDPKLATLFILRWQK